MNTKKIASVVVLSMVVLAAGSMIVAAMPPQIPDYYWGYATLNGEPAPIGTEVTVEVYGTGEVVGSYTIKYEDGLYVMKILIDDSGNPEDGCAGNGDPLTFKLNGIECSTPAPGTQTAKSGGIHKNFSLVASASEPEILSAAVDIKPETLNLQSKGKWITCYIELPEGYDVADIDVSTILLEDAVSAEASPTEIGDYDDDSNADLMVKFDRSAVIGLGLKTGDVELTVTGSLSESDNPDFEGSGTIKVIDKGKK